MYTFGVRVFFIKLDVNSFYQLVFFMTFDVLAHFFYQILQDYGCFYFIMSLKKYSS